MGGQAELDRRPEGVTDATVRAVAKVSEAFEAVEELRGRLYGVHRLVGIADFALGEACALLRDAGHRELADQLEQEVVGRNLIPGHWTFQIVEEFDDGYYADFRRLEKAVRDELVQGRRHVYESGLKQDRRTEGLPGHEATPEDVR
ncbi:hypothetical protein [Pedococcus sp. 5OH_020]|uniref:hypothetical protein n=1 Tax=Pedococcus sp. 5OH_020 TaxID=2989814 RepID=UPI0022E9AAAC|nr:hypothetical protein [Pedococcus sp. 5OH_020]